MASTLFDLLHSELDDATLADLPNQEWFRSYVAFIDQAVLYFDQVEIDMYYAAQALCIELEIEACYVDRLNQQISRLPSYESEERSRQRKLRQRKPIEHGSAAARKEVIENKRRRARTARSAAGKQRIGYKGRLYTPLHEYSSRRANLAWGIENQELANLLDAWQDDGLSWALYTIGLADSPYHDEDCLDCLDVDCEPLSTFPLPWWDRDEDDWRLDSLLY